MTMEALFYPHGVAVIGSMSPGKLGAVLIGQILEGGYPGEVYAVNPKAEGACGVPAYRSIREIGKSVDLAVIASPAASVAQVLEDCGQAGVKAAVVITSGFSETGQQDAEEQLVAIARRYGMRFVGPNCAGMVNTSHRLFPTLELKPPAGEVALISQSGALAGVILAEAAAQGLGISKFVSYGNGADLTQVDFLHYLSTDAATRVVALYVESVTHGRDFMDALAACSRVKPVVVIKAGRTSAGQRATASHTGSLAGSDAVYESAIRQSGAVRVRSVEDLIDLCSALVSLPPVQGKRLAVVTNSGGPGVLAADRAEELGLEVAEPSQEIQERLREFLPAHCSLKNPIDLTVEGTQEGFRQTLQAVLDEYDAALVMNVGTPFLDSLKLAQGIVSGSCGSGKPVLANFLPQQVIGESVSYLKEHGIPNFASGERAVNALSSMAQYYSSQHNMSQRVGAESWQVEPSPKPRLLPGTGQMLEPEAMTWLGENGIPVPPFRVADDLESALMACSEIGYPVVMKVVSPDILHKSDFGGVVVDIRDINSARKAFETLKKVAAGKVFCGVVIYPMVRGGQEVLVGLTHDPQFGPSVAFGLGGIYTEIWRDISLRIAPVDLTEAQAMITEIRAVKLLQGVRGRPGCDLDTLADIIVRVSRLPLRFPEIGEIDLNPIFLFPQGLLVGDARVIRREPARLPA